MGFAEKPGCLAWLGSYTSQPEGLSLGTELPGHEVIMFTDFC